MYMLTTASQYGCKEEVRTIAECADVYLHIEQEDGNANELLMDISGALGAIDRARLWDAISKKGDRAE